MMLARPLRKRMLISHTLVTSATDDNQIIQHCRPSFGLGHIMAALKVEDGYPIGAPGRHTFPFERLTHISDPKLLSHCARYLCFWRHYIYLCVEL
jgi:hypothetical protein